MNELLARYLWYPLWEVFSQRSALRFYRSLNELEKSQWLSRDELDKLRSEKLSRLLQHAYEHVPYYRKVFDERKLSVQDIHTPADLKKLPFLTKDLIRKHRDELKADNYKDGMYWTERTGGSTGKPLEFFRDKTTHEFLLATERRFRRWEGYDIGTKFFTLWGAPRDLSRSDSFRSRVHYRMINHYLVNSFDMSDNDLASYYAQCMQFRPKVLHGYANAVYQFAKFIKTNNLEIPKLQAISTASEKLYPYMREYIEAVFSVRTFEEYGCREMGLIAHECDAHDGLHLADEKYVLEVVDGEHVLPEEEVGDIAITDLNNFAMPFIRYLNGDRCTIAGAPCSCGRQLTKIREIEGRVTDFLLNENGRRISGVALTTYFAKIKGIDEFQFRQKEKTSLAIHVVANKDYNADAENKIKDFVSKYISPNIDYTVKKVKKINTTASGKRKSIVQELTL